VSIFNNSIDFLTILKRTTMQTIKQLAEKIDTLQPDLTDFYAELGSSNQMHLLNH